MSVTSSLAATPALVPSFVEGTLLQPYEIKHSSLSVNGVQFSELSVLDFAWSEAACISLHHSALTSLDVQQSELAFADLLVLDVGQLFVQRVRESVGTGDVHFFDVVRPVEDTAPVVELLSKDVTRTASPDQMFVVDDFYTELERRYVESLPVSDRSYLDVLRPRFDGASVADDTKYEVEKHPYDTLALAEKYAFQIDRTHADSAVLQELLAKDILRRSADQLGLLDTLVRDVEKSAGHPLTVDDIARLAIEMRRANSAVMNDLLAKDIERTSLDSIAITDLPYFVVLKEFAHGVKTNEHFRSTADSTTAVDNVVFPLDKLLTDGTKPNPDDTAVSDAVLFHARPSRSGALGGAPLGHKTLGGSK